MRLGWIESLWMDLKYSARRLATRPAYVWLAVLTLALGAGGTAAVVSVIRPLLLEPLPYAREEELGVLWMGGDWTEQEFLHLRPGFPGFQGVASYMDIENTLEMPGEPLRLLQAVASSAELFSVLGARPLMGRTFQAGDDLQGSEPVVVLSHGMWRELGADSSVLGRTLHIGGIPRTVVGVMPPSFWFPNPTVQVWMATPLDPENRTGNYTLLGRIDRGARMDRMDGPLGAIVSRLKERFQYRSQWDKTRAPEITPIREELMGGIRPALLATLVAMVLLLSMACVNASALMLGQVGGRSAELAVRAALGAGRRRLVQQIVIEALLIGALAGAAGAMLAASGFHLLLRALPLGALEETARLDWTLFWFAIGAALLAAAFIALIPAVVVWRGSLRGSMSSGTRTGGISPRGGKVESGLVVAQVALAVLLAAGAGLLLRSVGKLRGIDPGLRVEGVAVLDTTLPRVLSMDDRRRAVLDILPSLQAIPGVRSVGATQRFALRGGGDSWGIAVEGKPELEASTTYFRIVTHDYLRTLGVPVRKGRGFEPSDGATSERVVVINEALAAKYFSGEDPIGRILHTGFEGGERVIGIVGNVAEANLTDPPVPARYMLFDQISYAPHQAIFVLAARSEEDLPAILSAAQAVILREGRNLAFQRASTLESVFDAAVGAPRQVATLLSLLATLALILGAVGVYGMISQFVARRSREYGIRIALGLTPRRVIGHVMGRGIRLVALGGALGVAAALVLTRLLSSFLYGVGTADPPALAGAVVALLAVGALASFVPARRASRTDPVLALRQQ
jgi:putative ABC transport system permease protein